MAPGGVFCLQPKDRGPSLNQLPQKGPAAGVQIGGRSLTTPGWAGLVSERPR